MFFIFYWWLLFVNVCGCGIPSPRKTIFGFPGLSYWSLSLITFFVFFSRYCFCLLFANVCNVETGKPRGKPHWKGKWKTKDMILMNHDILPKMIFYSVFVSSSLLLLRYLVGVKTSNLQTTWPSSPDLERLQILNIVSSIVFLFTRALV